MDLHGKVQVATMPHARRRHCDLALSANYQVLLEGIRRTNYKIILRAVGRVRRLDLGQTGAARPTRGAEPLPGLPAIG